MIVSNKGCGNMKLANNLKELRKQNKLTQLELTKILGLNKTTIANIESRGMQPSLPDLIKLADFFNVSIDILVGRVKNNTMFTNYLTGYTMENILCTEEEPLWIRNVSPTLEINYTRDYVFSAGKIEVYNPMNYHYNNNRIYLDILNIDKTQACFHFNFYKRYGFIGVVPNTLYDNNANYMTIIDRLKCVFPFTLSSNFNYITHYFENDSINDEFSSSFIAKTLESNPDLPINSTYKENINTFLQLYFALLQALNDYNLRSYSNTLTKLETYLKDIDFLPKYQSGEFKIKASYSSLAGFVCLELLLDMVNDNAPKKCNKCYRYYVGNEDEHNCEEK